MRKGLKGQELMAAREREERERERAIEVGSDLGKMGNEPLNSSPTLPFSTEQTIQQLYGANRMVSRTKRLSINPV